MKVGDLVSLNWGPVPELEHVKPTAWFAQAVSHMTPLIFLSWAGKGLVEEGWATLWHPDGTKKIVHADYFTKVVNESR